MNSDLSKYWWLIMASGMLALVFGMFIIFNSSLLITVMMVYFGIMVLLWGGVFLIGGAMATKYSGISYFWILEGVVNVAIGSIIVIYPVFATVVILVIIGMWAIIIGIIQTMIIIKTRSPNDNQAIHIFSAALAIAFGVFIMIAPFKSAELLTVLLGVYCLLFGINSILIALKMKRKAVL